MTLGNHYQTLEVEPLASAEVIKAAYRRLARKYHPDINPGNPNAEAMFKHIGEAYAVLSDPQKRQAYDQAIGLLKNVRKKSEKSSDKTDASYTYASKAEANPKATARPKTAEKPTEPKANGNFKDMFDSLFRQDDAPKGADSTTKKADSQFGNSNGVSQPSQQAYNAAPKPQNNTPKRGDDITVDTVITQEEALNGTVKTVAVQHTELCKRCSGLGKVNGLVCTICQGEKQLVTLRKIDVRLPAGVKPGSKIRVSKEGGKGLFNGEPGDLFLLVQVEDAPGALKVHGIHVSSDVFLSIPQAVFGAELEIPTLHGKAKLVIPQGTSSGKTFQLKGQGVHQSTVNGDHIVTIQIQVPKNLSPEERSHYEALAKFHHS